MGVNFEKLLVDLVTPLVIHTEDVSVTLLSEDEEVINMQILVHQEDLGRVIGKNGKIASAIRTIAYASAARLKKRITIDIDSF